MPENMTTLDRIDTIRKCLDNLVEAQGRAKAGYIYVIDDFLNRVRDDVLIMEEKLKDAKPQEKPEISIEPVPDETMSQE